MSDDLDAAYAKAHALTDDGRGPSAAVRANVLAAAREIATDAQARVAAEQAPPLTPVAPPVAAVGGGRARAVNLASWRVRAGAAFCAALLVAVVSWRFDESGRLHGDVDVALAELKLVAPPTAAAPQELPAPAITAASSPPVPLAVVEDPLGRGRGAAGASGKPSVREPDRVVAQADTRDRAPLPQADLLARAQRAPVPADAEPPSNAPDSDAARLAAAAAPPSPSPAAAPLPAPPVAVAAAAAPQIMTAPAMPPSVVGRRYLLAPRVASTAAAPERETTVAAARPEIQRVDVAPDRGFASASVGEALRKAAPATEGRLVGASARLPPAPLQSAADRGDVEALKRLLADPATRVDAPDAMGRTALLHAVLAQRIDAVRLLVAAGADPGRADAAGLTPRAAAQSGASVGIAALLAAPAP